MHRAVALGFAGVLAVAPVGAAHAEENPIFGKAIVQPTTQSQNKAVVGKGYYADLYGYYGNYYSAYASLYGSLGSYFKSSSYYTTAESYASSASTYYYYAAYYQSTAQ